MGQRARKRVERRPRVFENPLTVVDGGGIGAIAKRAKPESDTRGGARLKSGRPQKDLLIGSICTALRPFVKVYGYPAYKIAADAARSIEHKYPVLKKVLKDWDALHARERERSRQLDQTVVKWMDLQEFIGLVFAVLKNDARNRSDAAVAANLPDLVEKSLEAAMVPANDKERMRHLETQGIITPPPGTVVNVSAKAEAQSSSQTAVIAGKPESFEAFMSNVGNIIQGAEVKALNPAPDVIDVEAIESEAEYVER
jgi:hypothetical protein